jgi:hypothetical protein
MMEKISSVRAESIEQKERRRKKKKKERRKVK